MLGIISGRARLLVWPAPLRPTPLWRAVLGLSLLAATLSGAAGPVQAGMTKLDIPALPPRAAATNPRPEYPRPDFARDHWLSLNGAWQFALDPQASGEAQAWYKAGLDRRTASGQIVVPFPWQSLAAFGQGSQASTGAVNGPLASYRGTVWYARGFSVPASFPAADRVLLNFGAAEQSARVWINGRPAGSHEGGYLPFTIDATTLLRHDGRQNLLSVEVIQPADLTGNPHGKQGGFWYSASGGLWQTVWLEAAGAVRVGSLRITPDAAHGRATLATTLAGAEALDADLTLRITDPQGHLAAIRRVNLGRARFATTTLTLPHALTWDVDHPWLYQVTVSLDARTAAGSSRDSVRSYFGLRDVRVGHITVHTRNGLAVQYPSIFVNGRAIYIRGALDQDFNPQGIYTAPSDVFLRDDILRAKAMGLNLLRIHIKVPDPRLLYWADRLGLLIWEEPPDFAEDGNSFTPAVLQRWQDTLTGMIARDYNHPATIIWGLFNEEWGTGDLRQHPDRAAYVARAYQTVKNLDPTRLVVDQSGWSHTRTDIVDIHQYVANWGDWRFFLDRLDLQIYRGSDMLCGCISGNHDGFTPPYTYGDQPVLMSEYAAGPWTGDWPNTFDARPDGFRDNSAPFRWLTNDLRLHPFIAGYIYTEFSDVEWEHNGLTRYDRAPRQFGYAPAGLFPDDTQITSPRLANAEDFLALDARPIDVTDPGGSDRVVAWLSHFSPTPLPPKAILHWRLAGYNGDGVWQTGPIHKQPVALSSDAMQRLATLQIPAPSEAFAGDVGFWLTAKGMTIGRNSVALIVPPNAHTGVTTATRQTSAGTRTTLTWTFEPGQFTGGAFSQLKPQQAAGGQVAWGSGAGNLTYTLALPPGSAALLAKGTLTELSLRAEAGAARRTSVIDQSAPQTDAVPHPSTVQVSIDGVLLSGVTLPDDPSDSRGILSLWNGYQWGEYGFPLRLDLQPGDARLQALWQRLGRQREAVSVRFTVPPGAQAGGLTLYGESVGRIPAPLSLRLSVSVPRAR